MSRKNGKSYCLSYLAIRQLFEKHQNIVYVVPSFDQAEQCYEYMERFIRDIWDNNLQFDRTRHTVHYAKTRSTIKFVSGESKMGARSKMAHLLIYDEASFISDKVEKSTYPLIINTEWYQVAASTPNPDTPINRFYFDFKEWELETDNLKLSIRRDLYNNDFVSEEEKQRTLKKYEKSPLYLMTECLAMFPTWGWVFNFQDFFLHFTNSYTHNINGVNILLKWQVEDLQKEYKHFVIWYDPWSLRDRAWLGIIWIKEMIETKEWFIYKKNIFHIIWESYIDSLDYWWQIDLIIDLKNYLWLNNCSVTTVIDFTWVWTWVYDFCKSKWLHPIRCMTTWQKKEPIYDNGYRKISKLDLESIFASAMWINLFWYNFLSKMKTELETYWSVERNADSHFDILSALFLAVFTCRKYIW